MLLFMCIARTGFSVRLDDDHHEAVGGHLKIFQAASGPAEKEPGMPTLGYNDNKIHGKDLSKDPHILPSDGTGGKLIRNVGCSKNIRKTLVSGAYKAVKHTIDALQCKGMASADYDCGEEVFTNGIYCACVLTGKTCDMVPVPGATMFIPTTTLPPNPLAHPKEIDLEIPGHSHDPCDFFANGTKKEKKKEIMSICDSPIGGAFIVLPKGDIAGNAYAVGHSKNLDDCKKKCCGEKTCEAIKFSAIGNESEVPAQFGFPDNCGMYSNISKFNNTMSQDKDFVVHAMMRKLQANVTLCAEKLEKREMLEAWFARQAAEKAKKRERGCRSRVRRIAG